MAVIKIAYTHEGSSQHVTLISLPHFERFDIVLLLEKQQLTFSFEFYFSPSCLARESWYWWSSNLLSSRDAARTSLK